MTGLVKDQKIQLYLTLAMETGYQTGEKPITAALLIQPARLRCITECWRSVCQYDDVYLQLL
ncbi:hypothetical protein CSN29_26240 [Salmonella enterica subsp. diarizonae]|nr:hypothetical protein [Salmonella enterica]ECC3884268.1 hypothetical protein [Salmonella enterica subsp. diarizonae]EDZ9925993.1 hypothetical protein [Salmonella enterica subsp. enterica serovar Enteritidis]ECJ4781291.1 hypothetical protein [Salmonella enterica subsp. diarizonae]ECQ2679910.1 hypothetical protein [Salmonella enterica]